MQLGKRYPWLGFKAGARWVVNPVSENGSAQVPRIMIAFVGPEILKTIEAMRQHPMGRRLLAERPDLPAVVTTMEPMGRLPEGSVGRVYYDLMAHPDTIAGYLVAGTAYKDGFFDSVQMSEEARWYLERSFFTHDLSHVLSGYGTDLSGESLNIFFGMGATEGLPKALAFGIPFGIGPQLLRPRVGRRAWYRHLSQAFDRGRAAARVYPLHSIYYEELLSKPLGEVQEMLGISPLPAGFDTADWLEHSWFARQVAGGFGQMASAKASAKQLQAAVEAGVPWRTLMRASASVKTRVAEIAGRSGPVGEMLAALA